jgi:hypothetical protein
MSPCFGVVDPPEPIALTGRPADNLLLLGLRLGKLVWLLQCVTALDEPREPQMNGSNTAGIRQLLGLLIQRPVAALEAEGDIQFAIGGIGSPHHTLAACHIHRRRLFNIDMLAGLDGCFKVFRVKKNRRRDDDCIDVARQHLAKVLV